MANISVSISRSPGVLKPHAGVFEPFTKLKVQCTRNYGVMEHLVKFNEPHMVKVQAEFKRVEKNISKLPRVLGAWCRDTDTKCPISKVRALVNDICDSRRAVLHVLTLRLLLLLNPITRLQRILPLPPSLMRRLLLPHMSSLPRIIQTNDASPPWVIVAGRRRRVVAFHDTPPLWYVNVCFWVSMTVDVA